MVSLEEYIDSQAAQVAEDIIKIYKVETAERDLSNDFREEKEAYDLKRLTEIRLKQGEDAAFEEYEKLKREEEAKAEDPIGYYLAYKTKDVNVSMMKELGVWPRDLMEEIADYCATKGKRPAILDELNNESLLHHFDLLVDKYEEHDFIILKVKEAEPNIRKIVRETYFNILNLLKEKDDLVAGIKWLDYVGMCALRVRDELIKIDLSFIFKKDLYFEAEKLSR